ncbi:VirB3 family type IV secretion system protein [Burkholderia gladioli]|jgi:type IV secretion system protein VirB3|uniref:VirB3 family type IV secretion system protein n=1 Tax=Burkholderia gladioli TaxID=28095 RepID=UPI00164181F0|nr:VirB3 family type IV secretion system protein [Burkholderia gladioli]MDN7465811.1 VirB3 family type IV secretion system protein [Burkholderia gladioli]
MSDERVLYSSYAALNRVALVVGVPAMPAMITVCASILAALFAAIVAGPGGALLGLAGVPVMLYFRTRCVIDDQALRIDALEFRCLLDRWRVSLFGKTYTLAPITYGRSFDVYVRTLARGPDYQLYEGFLAQWRAEAEERQDEAE